MSNDNKPDYGELGFWIFMGLALVCWTAAYIADTLAGAS